MQKNEQAQKILNNLSQHNEPGFQYVVVDSKHILFEKSIGLSNIRRKTKLNLDQTMAAFSMTKTLTAIAILQLVGSKKIAIDSQLSEYVQHPYSKKITIRQLINHTSGIPNPIPLKWIHFTEDHKKFDENNALQQVLKENPSFDEPDKKYKYSNISYWLLGQVIEKVSGEKYTEYININIFQVLNLSPKEIGFSIKNNYAKGYLKKWSFMNIFGRFFINKKALGKVENGWVHIENFYLNGAPFGGIVGSAKAFSKILQDLLSQQSKLLKTQEKQLLYSQQQIKNNEKIEMTLGWHIGQLNNNTYYFKEGGGAGFHCEMRIYPKQEIASVLMANRTSLNTKKVLGKLDILFL